MLGAQREDKVPDAVGIAYSVFVQNRHPRVVGTATSDIKVTHDYCFVPCTDGVQLYQTTPYSKRSLLFRYATLLLHMR